MGQTHSTRTSFDATSPSYGFGYRFVQGTGNGPGTGGSQYYSWYIGLGSEYPSTGGGSYGAMFAIDRNVTVPYLTVRYNESNSFSAWRKVAAGYADTAGSATDSTKLPLSGGTMSGAISFQQPVGLNFANGQYIRDNGSGGLVIYSGAAINLTSSSSVSISGTNSSSVPIIPITVTGSGTFQRGVRMLNSGMGAGDSLMYAVGAADNSKNMGQFYFYYAGSGSNSNRLSLGLHSVDDIFNLFGTGNISLGTTTDSGFRLNISGTGYATGDFRAPIFYDSNNTAYYLDPAGNSYLNSTYFDFAPLTVNFRIVTGSGTFNIGDDDIVNLGTSASARSPVFYDYNDTAWYVDPNSNSRLNQLGVGSNNTSYTFYNNGTSYLNGAVTIDDTASFTAGNQLNFYTSAGSLRGYINVTDTDDNHFQIATSGGEDIVFKDSGLSGTRNLVIRGNNAGTEAYGSMRSPIFYDSNDTNYYCDPNGTSRFSILTSDTGIYAVNGWWTFADDSRNPGDSNHLPNTKARAVRFSFAGANYTGTGGNYSGVMHFAPWEGTTASTGDASYQLAFGSTATNGGGTPQLVLRKGIDTTWNAWYYIPMYGVNVYTSALYATIFYDTSDTAYYGDFANTGTAINAAGAVRGTYYVASNYSSTGYTQYKGYDNNNHFIIIRGSVGGTTSSPTFTGAHSTTFVEYAESNDSTGWFFRTSQTGNYDVISRITRSYSHFNSSVRSPLFYDSDDTTFYVDPANGGFNLRGGTSNRVTYVTDDSGIKVNNPEGAGGNLRLGAAWGRIGLYNSSYNELQAETAIYFRIANAEKGYIDSSSNFFMNGSARAPIFYDSNDTGYYFDGASTSRTADIYTNRIGVGQAINASWPLIVNGNAYLNGGGYGQAEGSWRAPIFYDSGNTAYYGDFASVSRINAITFDQLQSTAYNTPNQLVTASDTNWTFGCHHDGSSVYYMQTKFYGTGDDTRGFRVLNTNGSTVVWRINGAGNSIASGNVTAYSDERLKTNWRAMPENFVSRLAKVKVGIYDRTDGSKITQVGVGAQSLQEVLPEAVIKADDEIGTLSVNYGGAALASTVELAKEVVDLRAKVERLESLISKLIDV
jgi:hypothetical protein